jgi:hypothetical protein
MFSSERLREGSDIFWLLATRPNSFFLEPGPACGCKPPSRQQYVPRLASFTLCQQLAVSQSVSVMEVTRRRVLLLWFKERETEKAVLLSSQIPPRGIREKEREREREARPKRTESKCGPEKENAHSPHRCNPLFLCSSQSQ